MRDVRPPPGSDPWGLSRVQPDELVGDRGGREHAEVGEEQRDVLGGRRSHDGLSATAPGGSGGRAAAARAARSRGARGRALRERVRARNQPRPRRAACRAPWRRAQSGTCRPERGSGGEVPPRARARGRERARARGGGGARMCGARARQRALFTTPPFSSTPSAPTMHTSTPTVSHRRVEDHAHGARTPAAANAAAIS